MSEIRLYYDLFKKVNEKTTLESVDLKNMSVGLNGILEASYKDYEGAKILVGMNRADAEFVIRISGENMYDAASAFMSRAGMPDTVMCDRYDLFDDVLKSFGKKTVKKSALMSRNIEDIISYVENVKS